MELSPLDDTESPNQAEKNYEQRNNTDSIKFEMQYQYRSLNKVPTVNTLTSPAGCRFVGQAELPLFERIPIPCHPGHRHSTLKRPHHDVSKQGIASSIALNCLPTWAFTGTAPPT